mmetsp:Transcript_118759/g.265137  ORF Transcript_118759/g.265137 Transcript_118759/m.265137 type:complete len:263 (-) Transcript_118759:1221-2009(-)
MLEVFLHHALHAQEVTIAQCKPENWPLPFIRPVEAHLEAPPHSQRQGEDSTIMELSLEELLVIGVPAHRHASVFVEVEVAGIGPVAPVLKPAVRHRYLHELDHPGWELLRTHFDTPIAVSASATSTHHPASFPRDRTSRTHRLLPLSSVPDLFEEIPALLQGKHARQEAGIRAPPLVLEGIAPLRCGRADLANEPQSELGPGLFPRAIFAKLLWPLVCSKPMLLWRRRHHDWPLNRWPNGNRSGQCAVFGKHEVAIARRQLR